MSSTLVSPPWSTRAGPASPSVVGRSSLSGLAFADAEFDGQFLRALDTVYAGGADIGECFATARSIISGDRESWYRQWRALGDRIVALADRCRSAGQLVSAREAYLRAVTYHRTSSIFLYRPPMDPRFVDAYQRQRWAFLQAAALMDWSFEQVAVPYEDTSLEAYLLKPAGQGPFPVMFLVGGYDGTKEETYFAGGRAALERGYALMLIDGPGQGGALVRQQLVFRPDWEAVVTPVVDWLIERPDVDSDRIVLMGRSWGGYLAPRAATREHRLAAVVADAAQFTPGPKLQQLVPERYRVQFESGDLIAVNAWLEQQMEASAALRFTIGRGMLTHGLATPAEYLAAGKPYTVADGVADISCPVLVCEAENDVRGGDAKPLFDALTGEKAYRLFRDADGAGEHDESGAAALFAQEVCGWLDEVLERSERAEQNGAPESRMENR